MKLTKKKVFVMALALSLAAIISMGSLAWFNDADSVWNKFMIADSEDDTPDEIFSIDVCESRDTNGDGDFNEEGDNSRTDEGLTYVDIQPGDKLNKVR